MDNERKQRDDELGALWRKDGGQKPDFFTGSCVCPHCHAKTDIVVFQNGFKTADNHPEFRILKSKPREEGRPSTRRDEAQYQRPQTTVLPPNQHTVGKAEPSWPRRGQQVDPFERETQQPFPNRERTAERAAVQSGRGDWTKDVPPVDVDESDIPF